MKIAINKCFGGFGISSEALELYNKLSNKQEQYDFNIERFDPILIQVIEQLGEKANGVYANIKIVNIPDNIEYHIDDYDGIETIHENHESWG